jgi:putative Mg2+ transporter-C (MgtC) family protein
VHVVPTVLHLSDFSLRIALTTIAGLLLGYNRSVHGKAAGLCTTMLVGTAAAIR